MDDVNCSYTFLVTGTSMQHYPYRYQLYRYTTLPVPVVPVCNFTAIPVVPVCNITAIPVVPVCNITAIPVVPVCNITGTSCTSMQHYLYQLYQYATLPVPVSDIVASPDSILSKKLFHKWSYG